MSCAPAQSSRRLTTPATLHEEVQRRGAARAVNVKLRNERLEPETKDGVLTGVGHMGAKASATARAATARSTERILDVCLEAARLVCSRTRPVKNEENVREREELGRKRVCEEHESRAIAARTR